MANIVLKKLRTNMKIFIAKPFVFYKGKIVRKIKLNNIKIVNNETTKNSECDGHD